MLDPAKFSVSLVKISTNGGENTAMARVNGRNKKGQGLVEVLAGAMLFLVPISLAALDLTTIVLVNSANDHLVKNCARAAADQEDQGKAQKAVQECISKFPKSVLIVDVALEGSVDYKDDDQVAVKTIMTVKLPVGGSLKFHAQAVEPLVAKPSNV